VVNERVVNERPRVVNGNDPFRAVNELSPARSMNPRVVNELCLISRLTRDR
jgi:hypothetical protein